MRRCLETGVLLAVLFSCVACVGPRLARCPGEGGSPWQELENEHFLLRTDLPPEEANKAMRYLERTRAALLAAAWPSASTRPMAKVSVYVLGDSGEFESLFPRRLAGFFTRDEDEPLIVLHGSPDSWRRRFTGLSDASSSTLIHELAHYLSSYFLLRQPRWLAEGLAQFLETLQLSEDGKTAMLGTPHLHAVSGMKILLDASQRGIIEDYNFLDIFAWDKHSGSYRDWEIASLYSGSWLLVHWLYNNQPRLFAKYQVMLAQGSDPDSTFKKLFPEVFKPGFDKTMLEYLKSGSYQEFTVPVPTLELNFVKHTLEDSEAHATRARLVALASAMAEEGRQERLALALTEMHEALKLNPKSLMALSQKVARAPDNLKPALARAAVEAHPAESSAWVLLAQALREVESAKAEREAAYKKAIELSPSNVSAANGLAWLYVTQGRYPEAFPLAQQAVTLAPWSSHILDTYALAAAGLGRCPEAILAEQRAIDLLQEHPDEDLESVLRARLATFSPTSCSPNLAP
ncbi:MAG TPA: tetratricopeptide repeat protein [Archangium sp.]|nr:tetratricopeptide repeat protein [Archangium sp.]